MITPRLSADPLRHRRPDEPWIAWATELYAHTLAELGMDRATWEAHFGERHPGEGYLLVLRVQADQLEREIEAAEAWGAQKDREAAEAGPDHY
jgi:hypothetical protein